MSISSEILTKAIGHKIKDLYGRDFGFVIHVYTEIDGTVTGVEVSQGNKFSTIEPSMLKMEGDSLIVLPDWKAEALRLLTLIEKIRKRQKALEELFNKQEIPKSSYDDMKRKLDSELLKLREDQSKLKAKLKTRLNDIEDQLAQLDKASISLKMSYIASEIPEGSYKGSIEILRQAKDSYTLERDDIKKTLDKLDSADKESMDIKSPTTIASPSTSQPSSPEPPKSEIPLPIPVKVINTL